MLKKLTRVGKMRMKKGHTLFKVNKETLEISKVDLSIQISDDSLKDEDAKLKNKRVLTDDNFVYVSALNEKNVQKKLIKMTKREHLKAAYKKAKEILETAKTK